MTLFDKSVCLCIDCSGSTDQNHDYWKTVASAQNNASNNYGKDKTNCILWNSFATTVEYNDLTSRIESMRGDNGTNPASFAGAEFLPEGGNVIIVTDGEVDKTFVQECDDVVRSRRFATVTVIFQNTGGHMNFSVSAPFTRNCDQVTIIVNGKVLSESSTSNAIDLQPYYNNPALFLQHLDELNARIVMKNLGSRDADIPLRNDLLNLKANLLSYIASNDLSFGQLRDLLNAKQLKKSIELMRTMIAAADTSLGQRLEKVFE